MSNHTSWEKLISVPPTALAAARIRLWFVEESALHTSLQPCIPAKKGGAVLTDGAPAPAIRKMTRAGPAPPLLSTSPSGPLFTHWFGVGPAAPTWPSGMRGLPPVTVAPAHSLPSARASVGLPARSKEKDQEREKNK